MAFKKEGDKTTASIDDLNLLDNITPKDKFLIQTSTGTYLLRYENLSITVDNLAFKEDYLALSKAFTSNESSIAKIGDDILSINGITDSSETTLTEACNKLNENDKENYNNLIATVNKLIRIVNANQSTLTIPSEITLPLEEFNSI